MSDMKKMYPRSQCYILLLWIFFWVTDRFLIRETVWTDALHTFSSVSRELILMFYGADLLEAFSPGQKDRWRRYARHLLYYAVLIAAMQFVILVKDIGFSVSLTFFRDYLRVVFSGQGRSYLGIFYLLVIFGIFAPYLRIMLESLTEDLRKSLFLVIFLYFLFFTSEVIFQYQIPISNFPFINFWGYIICGWLVTHIHFNRMGVVLSAALGGLSCIIFICVHFFFPQLESSMDYLFVYRLGTSVFLFSLIGQKRKPEWNLFAFCLLIPFIAEVLS